MSWTSGRTRGGFNSRVARQILAEEPECRLCGAPSTEADHIVPWAEGGSDARENGQGLCTPCHTAKSLREKLRGIQRRLAKATRPAEKHPSER